MRVNNEEIQNNNANAQGGQAVQGSKKGYIKFIIFVITVIVSFSAYKFFSSGENAEIIIEQFRHLISSKDKYLNGEEENRINILVLGIGGEGHNGPNLTDTMILASFKPSENKLAVISVPRDMLADIPNVGKGKINHVYAFSEAASKGSGGYATGQVVSKIFGVDVHYFVTVDFNGFVRLIDSLGGITVDVENTLDDEFYPVVGKEESSDSQRYEHLYIKSGIRHMDGETALKFVRSRKAKGIEGSDFARSLRQQKVLLAVKNKVLSFGTLFNPHRIDKILDTLQDHIDTNMELWEMIKLYTMIKDINATDIILHVLDDSPQSPLVAMTTDGNYYLVTKTHDYSELYTLAENIFTSQTDPLKRTQNIPANPQRTFDSSPSLRIAIHNGTKKNGLANRVAEFLKEKNYSVVEVKNAPVQTYKKTLLYNLQPDQVQNSEMQDVNVFLKGIIFESGQPEKIFDETGNTIPYPILTDTDILIILGEDQKENY